MKQKIIQYAALFALLVSTAWVGHSFEFSSAASFFTAFVVYLTSEIYYIVEIGSLKRLISSSDLPMYYFDKDYKITWANNEYANLLEVSPDWFHGKTLDDVIFQAASLVANQEHKAFVSEQREFIKKIEQNKLKHPHTTVIFNHKTNNKVNKAWLHADILYKNGKREGAFVIAVPLERLDIKQMS